MSKKVCIIGFFAFNSHYNGGQENKTRALGKLLTDKYGANNVVCIDTMNWKKNPFLLLGRVLKAARRVDTFIMLPAQNGVHVFSFLLLKLRGKKLFYSVIGGWLPQITEGNKRLKRKLYRFDGIWVETKSLNKALIAQGFTNTKVIPNFKELKPVNIDNLSINYSMPYKFCTFSRVVKEKGIEDAIEVISKINKKYGKQVAELDIYGVVDADYIKEFERQQKRFPAYITYAGVVPYDDTVSVLVKYFALLFPTHYYTEGVPGTIIDAYAAGVPVISARWESFNDIVAEGITGYGFIFGDVDDFYNLIERCIENPRMILDIKKSCSEAYCKYSDTYAYELIKDELNR